MSNTNGSNWIRKAKRLRIYKRDNWRCVWCGCHVAIGDPKLKYLPGTVDQFATLDHFIPRSRGGCNHETNLLTACKRCNDLRRDFAPTIFAEALAIVTGATALGGLGVTALTESILFRAVQALERPLPK